MARQGRVHKRLQKSVMQGKGSVLASLQAVGRTRGLKAAQDSRMKNSRRLARSSKVGMNTASRKSNLKAIRRATTKVKRASRKEMSWGA